MSLNQSATASLRRPKRKIGIVFQESPILAYNSKQEKRLSWVTNDAPKHRATFAGVTEQSGALLGLSGRTSRDFSTFKAGSGTKIIISSAQRPNNREQNTDSSLNIASKEEEVKPYFFAFDQALGLRESSFGSSFDSQVVANNLANSASYGSAQLIEREHRFEFIEHKMPPDGDQEPRSVKSNDECQEQVGHSILRKPDEDQPHKLTIQAAGGCQNDLTCNKTSDTKSKHTPKPPFPLAGILAAVFASITFSTSVLCIKLIPDSNSLQERTKQLGIRGLILMMFTTVSIIYNRSTFLVKKDEILVLLARSVFGYSSAYSSYLALNYISLGEAQAIGFTSPIWTTLMGYFLLGEAFSWPIIVSLPVSVLGIILIAHPDLIIDVSQQVAQEIHYHHHEGQYHHASYINQSVALASANLINASQQYLVTNSTLNASSTFFDDDDDNDVLVESYFETRWPGIMLAIANSVLSASVYVVLKFRKSTPVQTTTFHLGLLTCIFTVVIGFFVGFGRIPDTSTECWLLLGNGFFAWLGQSTFQWAASYESASVLAVIRALDVVMSFVYSVVFLAEDVLWTSVVGSGLILVVVAVLMLKNYLTCTSCRKKSQTNNV